MKIKWVIYDDKMTISFTFSWMFYIFLSFTFFLLFHVIFLFFLSVCQYENFLSSLAATTIFWTGKERLAVCEQSVHLYKCVQITLLNMFGNVSFNSMPQKNVTLHILFLRKKLISDIQDGKPYRVRKTNFDILQNLIFRM